MDLDVDFTGGKQELRRAALVRTRRIFEGLVCVPAKVWTGAQRTDQAVSGGINMSGVQSPFSGSFPNPRTPVASFSAPAYCANGSALPAGPSRTPAPSRIQ